MNNTKDANMNSTKKTNMNNKNALAELAEQMGSPVELMPGTGDSLVGLNRNQLEAYKKATRIVAELAKVQVADGMPRRVATRANCLEYSFGNELPKTVGIFTTQHFPKWICSALNAVENCRVIAKEGTADDRNHTTVRCVLHRVWKECDRRRCIMSADEIRMLTDLSTPVMPEHWQATVMRPEQWDKIKAALLAYAAMVERCDWQKSHLDGLLDGKDYTLTGVTLRQVVDTEKSIVDYILHGDVGKEEK